MEIIKRDGRLVPFDKSKIEKAVLAAFTDVDGSPDKGAEIAAYIADDIEAEALVSEYAFEIEQIQNMVESKLMESDRKDVARAYITYRDKRTRARERDSELMRQIGAKLNATNVVNQNANVDERAFSGRLGEAQSVVAKRYALDNLVSPMARKHHDNNEIYIHDLDSYALGMHNCLTLPIDDLLANGFVTRQTDVRPAGSVKSAMQLVAVLFQLQSLCQFGGVAASHLDWSMVPYVRKSFSKHYRDGMRFIAHDPEYERDPDKSISDSTYRRNTDVYEYALAMTKEEVKQATEAMFHNLNTLQSRSGGQLPFSSINFGTCTLPEGRMVIRALLETSLDGLGRLHTTPIFPCSIFKLKTGINRHPGDPNYDLFQLALKSTAKRLYPNYANVDWSGNAGYDPNDPRTEFSTMGCRTANGFDINGFGQLKDGRGNICPVTIILPTIAMYALDRLEGYENDAVDENTIADVFIDTLDGYISDAKDMLIERFDYITSQSPASAPFMYQNDTMAGYDGKTVLSAMKHGTLAIGQLGLAEALQLLIGCDHTTPRGMALAKRIEQLFKDRCAEYKQAYHMNFGVYFTPAENLCYTAMTKFRDRYGVIPNVSDKDFFTNSTHVPVWVQVDPFTKIDIEAQLTGYSSAGCITYVELDTTAQKNLSALETLVNYAMDKDVPYFAINVPNDTCMDCGYTDELGDTCPMCGGTNIQRLRRVTGYLTGNYTTAFNLGKQQEVQMRFQHTKLSPMFHEGADNGFDC